MRKAGLGEAQTMVEVIKITVASFKRSPACAAALSAPNPVACHWQLTPPLKTLGHSQASLGQSLVRLLLLSPGSWYAQGFVSALQESVSPVLLKFWLLYGGVNGDLFQRGLCHIQVCPIQSPWQATDDPSFHKKHSDTQRQVWLSLCGVSSCTQVFIWVLWVSLESMGFDSKHKPTPHIVLLGLCLCPWTWGIFFSSKILFWSSHRRWAQVLLLGHLVGRTTVDEPWLTLTLKCSPKENGWFKINLINYN